ncbi:hypothetical protein [Nocardia blacklockiae]|uniref:hypothetical protein n=1 Tax=Nocardia blacklockiae TaxID=480036 RepID=UPI001894E650|nr:hypothetical protein [Nocardia blacklockiae]MBF6175251.1 hypothetical protein [Nocardia blacklockiae]
MVRGREWTGFEAVALQEAMRRSVREFAALLGIDPSTVINWRSGLGSVLPRSVTQAMLDTTLEQRVTAEDLARFEQIVAEGEFAWRTRHERSLAKREPTASTVGGSPPGAEGEDAVERKTFLQMLTGSMAGLALGATGLSEAHERLVATVDEPPRVDAALVAHFDRICDYCRHQDDVQGAQAVLTVAQAQLRLLHAMLADCPARLQPQLLAVYSKFAGLAGWLSLDGRQFANSWRYFEVARAAAEQAGAPALIGFTLARMSHVAKAQDRVDLATDYASAAVATTQQAEPLVRTFAYDQLARAYAKSGDEAKCLGTLEQTHSSYQHAKSEAAPQDTSLAYFYDDGFLPHTESQCFLNLGQPERAVSRAEQSLMLHDPKLVRDNAFSKLYLATTYVHSDEPEQAVGALMDAAGWARQNRSVQLAERIQTVRASMGPWQGSAPVVELDGYLRDQPLT